jgi:predicted nucleotide-binding protein
MPTTRLPPESLSALLEAAIQLRLDRDALLLGVNRSFVGQLASAASVGSRILTDLHEMNMVDLLTDDSDPLRQWLMNAIALSDPRPEANVFRAYIHVLSPLPARLEASSASMTRPSHSGSGAPPSRHSRAPRVIVLSSHDTLDICRVVQGCLSDEFLIDLDHDGRAESRDIYASSLRAEFAQHDFAVFVPGANARFGSISAHDAVTFAIGIAMGVLGPERVLVLQNRAAPIPSVQITGAVTLSYLLSPDRHDLATIRAGMSVTCSELRAVLRRIRARISQLSCADDKDQLCALASHPLSDRLRGIINNTRRAMLVDHAAFRNEVEFRLDRWRADTSAWSHGTFIVGKNYKTFLKSVYAQARHSVFSTSVPEYRDVWISSFGRELLNVHKNNTAAKVVRVFVYNCRSDVVDEDYLIFAEQEAAGVEILLYFDQEDDLFLFPLDLGRDWAVVDDGRVIGVTRKIGEALEAKWYFDDEDQSGQFRGYIRRLVERCEPYAQRPVSL